MSKEIKIGLIGAGWMGKAHTTAFHNARMIFGDDMPVFELVSGADMPKNTSAPLTASASVPVMCSRLVTLAISCCAGFHLS